MSSPTKKGVGRPTKLHTTDQVRDMIVKYHNFHEMAKQREHLMLMNQQSEE